MSSLVEQDLSALVLIESAFGATGGYDCELIWLDIEDDF